MSIYGMKVGSNLSTDSDLILKLTSEKSNLKLFRWGDAQFTTNGSGVGSVTINHGLGFTPICIVMKKFTAQYTFLSATSYTNAFRNIPSYNSYDNPKSGFTFDADDTNLVISTENFGLGGPANNTTYYFRYMILVDLSDDFSGQSNVSLTGDSGFKISKPGKSVFDGQEYDMAKSSKYKSLQFYSNHILESSLTLPEMWANSVDTYEEEATYVDFNHNLGYAPFFLFYTDYDILGIGGDLFEMPVINVSNAGGGNFNGLTEISGWSDANRVRVLFKRISQRISGSYGEVYSAKTINIKVIIFAENLTGEVSS